MSFGNLNVGFAVTGSFCTLKKSVEAMRKLKETNCNIFPVMSEIVYTTDTRFGTAGEFINLFEEISGRSVIKSIKEAEPIGPKQLLDIMVVLPCTGNTVAKIANGITDTSVTMAVKAHLRNQKPVVIGISTNDGLANAGRNIGKLMNMKNVYMIPFSQDDFKNKPSSLVANFDLLIPAMENALAGIQMQPLLDV